MAGRGPQPKDPAKRVRRAAATRGDAVAAQSTGWQHGTIPSPPDGLKDASAEAWSTWFGAWFAAHWEPTDVPGLRQVIRLYDEVERGEFVRATELRLQMDTYGITPKGQQDRRWAKPKEADATPAARSKGTRYQHLKAV